MFVNQINIASKLSVKITLLQSTDFRNYLVVVQQKLSDFSKIELICETELMF